MAKLKQNHFKLFTSESVTEGHPDKMADQISDAILDALIKQDPKSRVACETLLTNGVCVVAGEITTSAYADISKLVRGVVKDIGYTDADYGFHWETSGVMVAIKEQSSDIAMGVDSFTEGAGGKIVKENLENLGAGDQGLMFGYACAETPELMPLPITLAHRLCKRLAEVRKKGIIKGLRPDGKSQVTIEYQGNVPVRVHTVLLAVQHNPEVELPALREAVIKEVIKPVFFDKKLRPKKKPMGWIDWQKETRKRWKDLIVHVNTTGRFVIGGPQGDTGLTGRKIIVDTYGGYARHGGGAFSGKDPTKVDRSAAYGARWVAKNVVAAGLADRVEVQVAYAIGVPEPLSVRVDTFGTGRVLDLRIAEAIKKVFDLRPGMLIKHLDLRRPLYRQIAAYGHFGRPELNLPWEKTDMVGKLKATLK
ncbi:methionine adenosyltransferase [Candidatus Uhrbacteria bacterium RIFCSPHIGHO2_12_FULL_47_11]|nr:MAG: methionine adenosyltransferase [Candidatus Uhrbacteria bacterium RIFCSPHIGHO2_01_FULL_47_11]OGL75681.1 MAG: methionine adenosyltransferase [Candidatus Uhrbacteria bacterium RIFCSPHIGHO2_12_FULL_47_11]